MEHSYTCHRNFSRGLLLTILFAIAFTSPEKVAAQCTATLTPTGTTTLCPGDTVGLIASPGGMYDYQWFIDGGLGPLGQEYLLVQNWGIGTHTISVQITDNNNCTVISNTVSVTILPTPQIWSYQPNPVCIGDSMQIPGWVDTATSYQWTGPNSFTSNTLNFTIQNFQASNVGIYTLTASLNNCQSVSLTVSADTIPYTPASLTVSAPPIACEGTIINIQPYLYGTVLGGTWTFTGPNNYVSSDGYIPNVSWADTGMYVCTFTGNNCTSTFTLTDSVVFNNVNPMPAIISATGNGPLCPGSTLLLNSVVSNGTFTWTGPNNFVSVQPVDSVPNVNPNINAGWYTLTGINGACTTSVDVNGWIYGNNPYLAPFADTLGPFCGGVGISIEAYPNDLVNPTYNWTGPNGFTANTQSSGFLASPNDSGMYVVTVSGSTACGTTVYTFSDSTYFKIQPCVWPGDVNNDLLCDNMDVLDLGLAYGIQGPVRPGAYYGWAPQEMSDWGQLQFCGHDMKFADCNGNGIITASDTFGISLNYNQVHLKGEHMPTAKSTSNTDLYFDMTGIVLTPGAVVSIPIKLGTSSIPMVNVYGLAAQIKMVGIVPPGGLTITAPNGWMGSLADAMNFTKWISDSQTDWAYVRTDHNNASGDGIIAMMQFEVPLGSDYQQIQFYFDNVRIIGNTGNVITTVNIIDGGATIFPTALAAPAHYISDAVVIPNPSDAQAALQITSVQDGKVQVDITDVTGRRVWNQNVNTVKGIQQIVLPTDVVSGMYQVEVKDEIGGIAKTLKWIRK